MSFSKKKILWSEFILFIIILGCIFVSGFFIGKSFQSREFAVINIANDTPNNDLEIDSSTDFSPFWYVWAIMNKLSPAPGDTTDEEKLVGATKGLVASFNDPYSVYFSKEEARYFQSAITGSFGGIGIEIGMKDGYPIVIAPLEGSPAKEIGIKAGDIILQIGEKTTSEMNLDGMIDLIRGDEGTNITLTLMSDGDKEPRTVTITREIIDIPTLKTSIVGDGKIFYIQLFSFTESSVTLFQQALDDFLKSNTSKLIIDLRGNPGGYLESAREIASWLLPGGKVIVTEKNADGEVAHRSKGYDIFTDNLSLVVLVDEGSASASEILAGALQDYKKATIIGAKTFGKGSVQELVNVPGGGALKVTVSKWFTPNDHSISDTGLTPDIEVDLTPEDVKLKRDSQLDKAVDYLLKKD